MARLVDRSKPAVFHHVTDAEHAARVEALRKRGGRPPLASPKKLTAIRLDEDVITHLRASGRGWQTRINQLLREALASGRI